MSGDPLIEAGLVIDRLRHSLAEGEAGLKHVPALLKRTLFEQSWRKRVIAKTGEVAAFSSFVEFVEAAPLEGLGADLRVIKNLVRDDDEAKSLLDKALQGKTGVHNVNTLRPWGNAGAAALRKLRKDRLDLHDAVIAGKLSPHRAMVDAGFRRPTATVYIDTPAAAVQGLLRRFTRDELLAALGGATS